MRWTPQKKTSKFGLRINPQKSRNLQDGHGEGDSGVDDVDALSWNIHRMGDVVGPFTATTCKEE